MNNIWKKAGLFLLFGVLCLGAAAVTADQVQAAAKTGNGVYSLDTTKNDSYAGADITNDGKKDKIETVVTEENVALQVNGKQMKNWKKGTVLPMVHVVVLSSKNAYLEICVEDYNTYKNTCALYQVKKGKLSTVLNYEKLVNNKLLLDNDFVYKGYGYDMLYAEKVSKNTIYLHASLGTKGLGQLGVKYLKLQYSKGKFTLKKDAGTITRMNIIQPNYGPVSSFTAAKKIQTVKAAGSSKKGITIAKDGKFTAKKLAVVGKNLYVQVKTAAGKTGWIKLSTSNAPLVTIRSEVIWG